MNREENKRATAERKAERNKKIQQLAVNGHTCEHIAELVGCSEITVKRVLKSVGFSRSDFQCAEVRHLYYNSSMSKEEIAKSVGVSLQTVYNYLKK